MTSYLRSTQLGRSLEQSTVSTTSSQSLHVFRMEKRQRFRNSFTAMHALALEVFLKVREDEQTP